MQPIDLTMTQLRLNPLASVTSGTLTLTLFAILFWTQVQLGKPAVQAARVAAKREPLRLRIPAAIGIGLVSLLAVLIPYFLGGSAGTKAKALAEQELGMNYKYHVNAMSYTANGHGSFYRASVTAWNESEVRTVPVEWSE